MSKNMNEDLLEKFSEVESFHWWWEGRRELVGQIIGRNKKLRILDIGCGTGETLTYLKKKFPKTILYGIDTSNRAIKYSQSRGHKKVIKASALKLPYKNNSMDVVLLLDVLEHIKQDKKVIEEAKRILRKGGYIFIASPALPFIWSKHDSLQGHVRRYTRRDIRLLAQINKMKVERLGYFNFLLSLPIVAIRLIGKLKPFSKLSGYDNKLNYEIARKKTINGILKTIFVSEIKLLKSIKFPFGASIYAKLKK